MKIAGVGYVGLAQAVLLAQRYSEKAITTPTDYDEEKNLFSTSSVESVLEMVTKVNPVRL